MLDPLSFRGSEATVGISWGIVRCGGLCREIATGLAALAMTVGDGAWRGFAGVWQWAWVRTAHLIGRPRAVPYGMEWRWNE